MSKIPLPGGQYLANNERIMKQQMVSILPAVTFAASLTSTVRADSLDLPNARVTVPRAKNLI